MRAKEFFLSPLEGFLACDIDETGPTKYYGFQNIFGGWIIMREASGVLRYAYGADSYTTNWGNRATVDYDLPSVKFTDLE